MHGGMQKLLGQFSTIRKEFHNRLGQAHRTTRGLNYYTAAGCIREKTFDEFDEIIGLKRLKAMHCNDSKVELGAHKDRHEHLGDGFIGIEGFEAIVKEKRLKDINLYLETEPDGVEKDLSVLKELRTSNAK